MVLIVANPKYMRSNPEEIDKFLLVMDFLESVAATDKDAGAYFTKVRNSTEKVKKDFMKMVSDELLWIR